MTVFLILRKGQIYSFVETPKAGDLVFLHLEKEELAIDLVFDAL